jgi:tungstate transport system substrate-binding protein
MWEALSKQFEHDTGYKVVVVSTGPKEIIFPEFQAGHADFMTVHTSDETTTLVADGYGTNMRPWAKNELILMGPTSDPAHVRGMRDGAAALKKIAETKSPFVDFYGPGSRNIAHALWTKAGIEPRGDWLLKDESVAPQSVVSFAAERHAYVIVGRIPILQGKIPSAGMEIMVQGDEAMRRPYVVMEANPRKFPDANVAGARVLADYLVSSRGQRFLRDYAARQPDGVPLFYAIDGSEP